MDILSLTSTEKISAVIGIDDHDFSETQFTDLDLDTDFRVHLPTWFPQWETLMSDVTGDAGIELQKLALQIYSKYYGARSVFTAAQMSFLQARSDGEVESTRFSAKSLENLKLELDAQLAKRMADVLGFDTIYTPSENSTATGQYTQFSRVPNSRDIITSG